MSTITFTPPSGTAEDRTGNRINAVLLRAGVVAGPLFLTVAAAQVMTRDGFDLGRHPISLLALGGLGWVQIANFVVTGLLVIGFGFGLGQTLRDGRGSRWIPRLVAGFGLGLIVAGVFVPDPENGFPGGTPGGPAAEISWHGIAHGVGAALAFDSLIVACILLALRLRGTRQRAGVLASAVVALALLIVPAPVSVEGISIRLAVAAVIAFGATTALAVWLLRQVERTRQNH